jgi:hypothetical protein
MKARTYVPKGDFLTAQRMVAEFTPYDLEQYGTAGRNCWEFRAKDEEVLELVEVWGVGSAHKALWAAFILEGPDASPSRHNPCGNPATLFDATGPSPRTLNSMTHEFTGWTQLLADRLTFPGRGPHEAPVVTT